MTGPLRRAFMIIGRHPDVIAVMAFGALALAFCGRFLVGGVLLPADALYLAPPWRDAPGAPVVSSVHNELIADLILQNYSWKQFVADSYRSGHFPLWNPYLFAGTPFLAAGQYAALYPFGLLFVVLPVAVAYGWFAALHLWLAGSFTYFYLRVIGAGRSGAFIGALAFQFAGFLVVSFVWPMILSAAIWLPLALAMCELVARHLERGTWNAEGVGLTPSARLVVPIGALAVGMQLLAGHLEISFYFLFTLMVYSAFRLLWALAHGRKLIPTIRAGFGLLMLVGLGFAIAAAQLLPFFELIRENYRIGQVTYAEVQGWALPPVHLLAYLIPDIFGNPTHHSYFNLVTGQWDAVTNSRDTFGNVRDYPFWGAKNYVEGAVYVGVAPLVLAAVALWRVRSKYVAFFAGYLVFCLLLALGTPLYLLIWRIPGVDQLHTPFRWAYPAAFCLIALAAIGAHHLITNARRVMSWTDNADDKRTFTKTVIDPLPRRLALVCLAVGGSVFVALAMSRLALEPTLAVVEAVRARSTMLSLAFPDAAMLYSYQAARLAGFGGVMALVAGGFALLARRPRLGAIALAAVVVIDLFATYYRFNTASTTDLVSYTPPSIAAIKQDTSLFRVTSFNYDDTLRPNSNMLFGLQDIRGYDTVILRDYVNYWKLLEEPSGLLYSMINKLVDAQSLQSPLLDLLNVKYVLTTQNIGLPGWTEMYRGEINVYRNERVMPRAFLVGDAQIVDSVEDARALLRQPAFDPRRTVVLEREHRPQAIDNGAPFTAAEVRHYDPGRVEIGVNASGPGYLVLADTYFPGWKAQIDGVDAPIVRANSLFRAVAVPAGQHTVTFKYAPFMFQIGLYLSLMGLFAVALGLGYAMWDAVYRPGQQHSTVQRIFKNSMAPMITQLANRFVDLAFAIVVARMLGPASVGEYAFAVVLIGYFSIFSDFGLGTLLTRDVARDRTKAKEYLANIVGVRLALCVVSLPILASMVALYWSAFNLTPAGALTIAFFALALFPSAISASYSSVFSAFEKMEYPAMLTSISTLLKVALGLAALFGGLGIAGLGAVSVVVNVVTAVILWRLLATTFFVPEWRFDTGYAWKITLLSFPLMLNNFLSSMFFRIDVLFLKPMQGDAAVGYYTTAYKFIDGLNVIPSFFTLAVFPIFARYAASSTDSLRYGFHLSLKMLLIISLPITVLTTLMADHIILTFFGEPFAPAIIALQVLIWFLPFSYINSVTHYVLIAVNQQRFLTLAFVIGVVFNVVANIIMIPVYGYLGAAITTIFSEIALLVPFFYAVHKHLGRLPSLLLLVRPTVAALAMGAAVVALSSVLPWPIVCALAPLVYLPALVAVGGVDSSDLALARRLFRRHESGTAGTAATGLAR